MLTFNLNRQGGIIVQLGTDDKVKESPLFKWAQEKKGFKNKSGEVVILSKLEGQPEVLLGLGDLEELDYEKLRVSFFNLAKALKKEKEYTVEIHMPDLGLCGNRSLQAVYEGFAQASYEFTKKTKKEDDQEDQSFIVNYTSDKGREERLKEGLKHIEAKMDGVFFTRELVNETSNVIYPETLAERAKELEEFGVKVTVFDEKEIQEKGMKAFWEVARGSDKPPRFIIMEYFGDEESDQITGLVGKGLTYDSGGYCIKPPEGMKSMHDDMGGSGTVIGAMKAIAKAGLKTNVVAVVAACENLISGHAFKTGDIIGSMKGTTIEVVNTDAEGRITLADAIYYITSEYKLSRVIDLATLTGACLVALAQEYTGAITNSTEFLDELRAIGDEQGEKIWQLPISDTFKEMNKSKVADLTNSGGRLGGTITAGLFVGAFLADEKLPWIHLDIAGTAYLGKSRGYLPERATGVHVKTLFELVNPSKHHHK